MNKAKIKIELFAWSHNRHWVIVPTVSLGFTSDYEEYPNFVFCIEVLCFNIGFSITNYKRRTKEWLKQR